MRISSSFWFWAKAEIEDHLNLSETKEKEDGWLITILLTFTVPLLLVWVYFSEKDIILINANELHEIISEKAPSTLLSLHILPQYFEGYFPQMSHISFLENTLLSKNERLFTYSFCKLLKI